MFFKFVTEVVIIGMSIFRKIEEIIDWIRKNPEIHLFIIFVISPDLGVNLGFEISWYSAYT